MLHKLPFHQFIKERRRAQGLARAELAALVGCSTATLSSLEQGVRRPSRVLAERLAHFLEIPPEDRESFVRAARAPLAGSAQVIERDSPAAPVGEQDPAAASPLQARAAQPAAPLLMYLGQLIGRDVELQQLKAQVLRPTTQLVTMIGPGGVGKTHLALRLASELAQHFTAGVGFVALSNQADAARLPAIILEELRLLLGQAEPSLQQLIDALRDRELLLVLDNLEHLVACVPLLGQLLMACPRLKLLDTSRSALHLHSEIIFSLAPLVCPAADEAPLDPAQLVGWTLRSSAVQLFVSRAQMASASFLLTVANAPVVAEICRRLDGLPLAIILAAARVRGLAPAQLLARLGERLPFLTSGGVDLPPRQRSLQELIDWSYDLLDLAERQVFRQLAVFRGRWTLEEAEAICPRPAPGDDLLMFIVSLLNKSLIQEHPGEDRSSFQMLELLREYAMQRLVEHGEEPALRERHARYYLALVEETEPLLTRQEQEISLNRLAACHDNLRGALEWLLAQGDAEGALRFTGAVWKFWQFRHFLSEGRRWLEAALELDRSQGRPPGMLRSKAAWAAGWLANDLQQVDAARALFDASLAAARSVADQRSIGLALQGVGQVALRYKEYQRATACFEEAIQIFVALDDLEELAWSRNHLAQVFFRQGDDRRSLALVHECLEIFSRLGHRWGRLLLLHNIGQARLLQGQHEQARTVFEDVRNLALELGDRRHVAEMTGMIGWTYVEMGDYQRAGPLLEEAINTLRILKANNRRWVLLARGRLQLAAEEGYQAALESFDEARRLAAEEHDTWFEGPILFYIGLSAHRLGQVERALDCFHAGLRLVGSDPQRAATASACELLAIAVALATPLGDQHARAAVALGMADQLRVAAQRPRGAPERPLYAQAYQRCCAALGTAQADALHAQGRNLISARDSAAAIDQLHHLFENLKAQSST
jgi:predicted ATPase/transcriptional regulator with XRE-family HTH domain